MLHVPFALDGRGNPVVKLVPDETGEPVPLREALAEPFSMLISAPGNVCGDPVYSVPFGRFVMMYTQPPRIPARLRQDAAVAKTWMAGTPPDHSPGAAMTLCPG